MPEKHRTAKYKIVTESGRRWYRFYCGLSNMAVCTTEAVKADTPEEELELTWEKGGRNDFNLCHKCGRWVSNVMYNVDTMNCVKCTPIENPPAFCPYCGKPIAVEKDDYCRECGRKLYYERGVCNDE